VQLGHQLAHARHALACHALGGSIDLACRGMGVSLERYHCVGAVGNSLERVKDGGAATYKVVCA